MSKARPQILLAEDDPNLGILLVDYLESEGFGVKLCKNGEEAVEIFRNQAFDLCLLDVMMPKLDGFSLAAAIRMKDAMVPLLFITARSMKEDKLKGYGLGADDYITKPFDVDELLWKVRAIIRRNAGLASEKKTELIQIGSYVFDFQNQTISRNNEIRRITEKESVVLAYLSSHRNTVVRREELLTNLWGENDYFMGRSLDVFITKIRKYLKNDPSVRIENVFGVGFSLIIEVRP